MLKFRINGNKLKVLKKIVCILAVLMGLAHPIKAQKDFKGGMHIEFEPDASEICALTVARMEEKYQIKNHLLETIASVESGVWNHQKEAFVSWPWSINVKGKGYRYDSKEEAVAAVKEFQSKGIESIDVGCMQISLKFHGAAFENVESALDPETNVEYSARFLSNLYQKKGDWQKAAMEYHSKVPARGNIYKSRLLKRFDKIKLAFLDSMSDISLF